MLLQNLLSPNRKDTSTVSSLECKKQRQIHEPARIHDTPLWSTVTLSCLKIPAHFEETFLPGKSGDHSSRAGGRHDWIPVLPMSPSPLCKKTKAATWKLLVKSASRCNLKNMQGWNLFSIFQSSKSKRIHLKSPCQLLLLSLWIREVLRGWDWVAPDGATKRAKRAAHHSGS